MLITMLPKPRRLLLIKKKLLLLRQQQQDVKKIRRYWIHPINRNRECLGIYNTLIKELQNPDYAERHRQYLRMSYENFDQ